MQDLNVIGVVGAGVMGRGLAQDLAQHGHKVLLIDTGKDILDDAVRSIRQNIRAQLLMGKKNGGKSADEILSAVVTSTDLAVLEEADFVVENATENFDIKKGIYRQIDQICRPQTVFAANTSAISITRIGSLTKRPDRILGMHFMNPVPMKKTVEVIRGHHTTTETIDTAIKFLSQFGKEGVIVRDSPGFVSNRVLMLTVNEAAFLVHDRVAPPSDIDKIFVECFGHKMGPLATADLIGLDTILYSIDVLYESFNDSKYRPCPLLKQMVDAGLHGQKSGRGFFEY
ncbi:3-hydroxyacyl-CoA dehydrogenase NAD-binding domain-containing protein [Rhodanobacter sp. C05]|uniref:3-hydroxyacyl-CoA dehydrogenase family protein n=1 Tax=Rhodanobacter sp. C05 TaxID=1945855 RepID=UPI000984EE3D|nr:3-hydroxyacyl-CoA dehydrogenase NAD-binding domain-containing protein [Rhodanobacter sp. C05]OOG41641.1 3-hydroxybutyryl-CoA dehydrogenase [Rhodanobacter sp. C05]